MPAEPGTTYHCHLDIRGALSWSDRKLSHLLQDENGDKLTGKEAREYLLDRLQAGQTLLAAAVCDNFDPNEGCKGHRNEEEATNA